MTSNTPRLDSLESNLVINGNFDFWQRGITLAGSTIVKYLSDRWSYQLSALYTAGSPTQSQSVDVPTFAQSGYQSRYSLLITNGTGSAPGATDFIDIYYKVEGHDYQRIHGKPVRFQFWVKSSVAGTSSVSFCNGSFGRILVAKYTINAANTWEKKTIDITLDTTGTWAFDNSIGLQMIFNLAAGATFQASTFNTWVNGSGSGPYFGAVGQFQLGAITGSTFQLAQVQLIPQDVAQAGAIDIFFQRAGRTIQQELTMCQRYCVSQNDLRNNFGYWTEGFAASTTAAYGTIRLPVTMRGIPTLTTAGAASDFRLHDGATATACSSVPILNPGGTVGTDNVSIQFTVAAGLTQFRPYSFLANNNQSAKLIFDAEL